MGLSVSRRVGNAVERNRIKRRLRSIFRHTKGRVSGLEIVVVVKPSAKNAPYAELRDALGCSIDSAVMKLRPTGSQAD